MANTKPSYFKGEDHQGRPMTAYQRGPADPDIVGRMFGMKNVKEITKAEFDTLNGLGGKQETKSASQTTPGKEQDTDKEQGGIPMYAKPFPLKPLSELKGKDLRTFGKTYGLDFSRVGMKLGDMRTALSAALDEFWKDDQEVKAHWAEKVELKTDETPDETPVPEDMTEAAGGADQEDD